MARKIKVDTEVGEEVWEVVEVKTCNLDEKEVEGGLKRRWLIRKRGLTRRRSRKEGVEGGNICARKLDQAAHAKLFITRGGGRRGEVRREGKGEESERE